MGAPPDRRDLLACALLVAVWALFHADVLGGGVYYFRDLYHYHVPMKTVAAWALEAGQAPLWNPYIGCGQPLLANPNNVAVHPLNFLFRLFDVPTAITLYVAIHRLVFALGSFWLARRLGLAAAGAFVSAILVAFGGVAASTGNFYITVGTVAWLPWVGLASLRWLSRHTTPRLLAAVGAWALLYLGGEPFTMLMAPPLLVLAAMAHRPEGVSPPRQVIRVAAHLALTGALTMGLVAVQLVPTAELLTMCERGSGYDFDAYAENSLAPIRLAETIVFELTGQTQRLARGAFWGASYELNEFPYMLSVYLGTVTWVLALAGLFLDVPRRLKLALAAVAAAGILLALGSHFPPNRLVFALTPPLWVLRFPVKWLFVTSLSLSLLAGAACDALVGRRMGARTSIGLGAVGATLLLLGAWGPGWLSDLFASVFPAIPGGLERPAIDAAIFGQMARAGLLWLAAVGGCVLVSSRRVGHGVGVALLAGLALIDFNGTTRSLNRTTDPTFFDSGSEAAGVLAPSQAWPPRVYEHLGREIDPGALSAATDDRVWHFYWLASILKQYCAIPHRVRYALDKLPDGLDIAWSQAHRREVLGSPDPARAMAEAGVEYLIGIDDHPLAGSTLVEELKTTAERPLRVRRLEGSAPWAGLDGAATASLEELTPNRFRFTVDAPRGGLFVLRETYHPGWIARVDDAAVEIQRHGTSFMAIDVPARGHRVVFEFEPRSYYWGRTASQVTAAILLLMLGTAWWRRRGPATPPAGSGTGTDLGAAATWSPGSRPRPRG